MKKQDKHVSVWLTLITGYCTICVEENIELKKKKKKSDGLEEMEL